MPRFNIALFFLLLMSSAVSCAYEVSTHAALSREAYERSALKTTDLLNRLGVAKYASVNGLGDSYADMAPDGSAVVRKNNPLGGGIKGKLGYTEEKFSLANEQLADEKKKALSFHSPAGWLMVGAIREDDVKYDPGAEENPPQDDPQGSIDRVLNHFYDPYHGTPLHIVGDHGSKAPDWAIEGTARNGNHQNHFSIKDAKEAMFRAATLRTLENGQLKPLPAFPEGPFTPSKEQALYWATVFRALGDAVHTLQDMAQPQHTRNDAHAGQGCLFGLDCMAGHASFYEGYIEARVTGSNVFRLPQRFYSNWPNPNPDDMPIAVSPRAPSYGGYPVPRFNGYYDYYRSAGSGDMSYSGKGLSNYSNMGFYSAGTNLGVVQVPEGPVSRNPYPRPPQNASQLTEEIIPADQVVDISGNLISGNTATLTLLKAPVTDNAFPEHSRASERLSSYSVFNEFLEKRAIGSFYSLNHYNYNAQAELLLPRAVAYSAGLIDHFFRGRMEISIPKEGFYGIVDHAQFAPPNEPTDAKSGFRGFNKIKLTLKNTTEDIVGPEGTFPQNMRNGIVVAVLKFHRNLGYTDDLDGEPGWAGGSIEEFLLENADKEELIISKPIALTSLAAGEKVELAFDFSEKGLPINAWPLEWLSVVYRGELGGENDAVIVSEKPISLPMFYAVFNQTDCLLIDETCYTEEQIENSPGLFSQLRDECKAGGALSPMCRPSDVKLVFEFGLNDNPPKMEWPDFSLPIRRFARVGLLADEVTTWAPFHGTFRWGGTSSRRVYYPDNVFSFLDPVKEFRGIKFRYARSFGNRVGKQGTEEESFTKGDHSSLVGEERYPVPATSFTGW